MKLYRCMFLLDDINYQIEIPAYSIDDAVSVIKSRYSDMDLVILHIEELNMF